MSESQAVDLYNRAEVERDSNGFVAKLLALTQLTPEFKLGVGNGELFIEYLQNLSLIHI